MNDATAASIGELLAEGLSALRAAKIPGPRLDAELLLAHRLGVPRATLTAHPEQPVATTPAGEFRATVARRAAGVPLAHLVGEREFYGHRFTVTPDVLIPRPETELLVDLALAWLAGRRVPPGAPPPRVLDLGTGSGCLVVTLARECREPLELWASDLSAAALAVARANAGRHGVAERIHWVQGDLLAPLAAALDLVICNPPYVAMDDPRVAPDVAAYEPALALRDVYDGDGLGFYRRLAAEVPPQLANNGALLVEVGEDQATAVRTLFAPHGLRVANVQRDLAGIERALLVCRG